MNLITDALGMSSYDASLNAPAEISAARAAIGQGGGRTAGEFDPRRCATSKALEAGCRFEDRGNLSTASKIRAESLTDPLTGLGSRKYFDRSIDMAVQTALASGEPLSLLMFDIDHFKSFNDPYGHLTGDRCCGYGMSLKRPSRAEHHRPLRRRGIRGRCCPTPRCAGADGGRSHPPRRDGQRN